MASDLDGGSAPPVDMYVFPGVRKFQERNLKTCLAGMLFYLCAHNFFHSLRLVMERDRKLPYLLCLAQTSLILCMWFLTSAHSVLGAAWDCQYVLYFDLVFLATTMAIINLILLMKATAGNVSAPANEFAPHRSHGPSRNRFYDILADILYAGLGEGRWIWLTGLCFIAVSTAVHLYSLTFLKRELLMKTCYLPITGGWAAALVLADVSANIFLTACFLRRMRQHMRNSQLMLIARAVYHDGILHALAILICSSLCAFLAVQPALLQYNILFYAFDVIVNSTLLVYQLSFKVRPVRHRIGTM
ncbi:hypothetical protein THASP1DRAFT_29285 [Thamnocephalis sphaerospora]|uniref:Uncharacterized protein n=1 Tax=Thamnocephalis sphaerospora TaxID=78915 RepID=A0A4V1IWV9_9FUNG|nr:hypothetical protein THASP1DRAFT_29285 [Thamnocephalis sphaerospora]|eukprot:RKP08919.1 hypothetical protein THASP1DRAFT_29285 [Thamnocephalis sphaerospora]